MKVYSFIFFLVVLASCASSTEERKNISNLKPDSIVTLAPKPVLEIDSTFYVSRCDTFRIGNDFSLSTPSNSVISIALFTDSSALYCCPSKESEHMGYAHLGDSLAAIETVSITKRDSTRTASGNLKIAIERSRWYKLENDVFINSKDITDKFFNHSGIAFLVKQDGGDNSTEFEIKSVKDNTLIHSYKEECIGWIYSTSSVEDSPLASHDKLFTLFTGIDACPGTEINRLYALKPDGRVVKIIFSLSEGEAGYFSENIFYIPTIVDQDTVLMNRDHNNPKQMPYPKNLEFSKENLIILTTYNEESEFDEHGNELLKPNGQPEVVIFQNEKMVYEWTGEELIELSKEPFFRPSDK